MKALIILDCAFHTICMCTSCTISSKTIRIFTWKKKQYRPFQSHKRSRHDPIVQRVHEVHTKTLGEMACLSEPALSSAMSWSWTKRILNPKEHWLCVPTLTPLHSPLNSTHNNKNQVNPPRSFFQQRWHACWVLWCEPFYHSKQRFETKAYMCLFPRRRENWKKRKEMSSRYIASHSSLFRAARGWRSLLEDGEAWRRKTATPRWFTWQGHRRHLGKLSIVFMFISLGVPRAS